MDSPYEEFLDSPTYDDDNYASNGSWYPILLPHPCNEMAFKSGFGEAKGIKLESLSDTARQSECPDLTSSSGSEAPGNATPPSLSVPKLTPMSKFPTKTVKDKAEVRLRLQKFRIDYLLTSFSVAENKTEYRKELSELERRTTARHWRSN
jgi:hypothetical protein